MRKLVVLLLLGFFFTGYSQTEESFWNTKEAYLGQTPPRNSAKLFAPTIIIHLAHSSPCFTPDGKEMYWSTVGGENETRKIYNVKFENNKWSEPILATFSGNYHDDQPFITHDGEKLFFASKRPKVKNGIQEMTFGFQTRLKKAGANPNQYII